MYLLYFEQLSTYLGVEGSCQILLHNYLYHWSCIWYVYMYTIVGEGGLIVCCGFYLSVLCGFRFSGSGKRVLPLGDPMGDLKTKSLR